MEKLLAIALNTSREAIRNKVVYSIFAFAVMLVACATFFGTVSIGDREQVVKDFGLFGMSVCGAMVTILLGVSLLQKELKQKTIYNILSKPVTRAEFIIGKHLGLSSTVILLVLGMGLALFAFLALLGNPPSMRLALSFYFVGLEMILLSAVVLFFSSMVITTTLPGILAFGTFIAGHSIANFQFFAADVGTVSPSLKTFIEVVSWIVPDLSLFNVNEQLLYGLPLTPAYTAAVSVYCIAYTVVALGLAILIFEHKEFQ